MDISGQRVGIGALQLGEHAPIEHLARQIVAFGRQLLERRGVGAPGPGLSAPPARQTHLVEQDLAELLGRANIEVLSGKLPDLVLEPGDGLGEGQRQARQRRLLDFYAPPLHLGENGRKRPLQRLIDRGDGFGGEAGFQDHPQPQADIGLLAGIFGGARHLDTVERHRVAAGAHDLFLGEAGIREEAAGEFGGQVLGASGVERIGHEAGIVDRRERDAVTGERHHVELGVLHDLQHALVFQDRLEQVQGVAHGNLRDRVAAKIESVAGAMG